MDSHMRPRYIPEVKTAGGGDKSHHVRLHITENGLKMSGRDVSLVGLHRGPGMRV